MGVHNNPLDSSLGLAGSTFLSELDRFKETQAADSYINRNKNACESAITVLINNPDQTVSHEKSLEYISSHIINSRKCNPNDAAIIKIATEKHLIKNVNPLHVAIRNNNIEMVRILLDVGYDANELDRDQNTPLSLAYAYGNLEIAVELMKRGANQNNLDSFISSLKKQQIAVSQFLIEQACEGKNGWTVEDLVKGMTFSTLNALLSSRNQGWSQDTVALLCTHGLDLNAYQDTKGNSILAKIIEKKDYPCAAFLVSQGASLEEEHCVKLLKKQHMNKSGIVSYAEALKKGTVAEQKLKQDLSIINLGHLLGDSFLKKMKSITGEHLEGNQSSVSLKFMGEILEYYIESEELSDTVKEKLQLLKKQFNSAFTIALQIEDAMSLPNDDAQLKAAIQNITKNIQTKLNALKTGEVLLIPCGWSGVSSGHATMLSCRLSDNGYIFDLINTGGGVEYHGTQSDRQKVYGDTIRSFSIPKNVIEQGQLVEQLITPNILGAKVSVKSDRLFSAQDLYHVLHDYERKVVEGENDAADFSSSAWMKVQSSGTCAWRCILPLIFSALGRDGYKTFNRTIKEKATQMAFALNKELLPYDPPLAKIFSEITPRLFGHINKDILSLASDKRSDELLNAKQSKIDELSAFQNQLAKHMPVRSSENLSLGAITSLPTETEKLKEGLAKLSPSKMSDTTKAQLTAPVAVTMPNFPLESIKTSTDLLKAMEAYDTYINTMASQRVSTHEVGGIFLRDLGRIFSDSRYEAQSKILLDSLLKDPETCKKVLSVVNSLCKQYLMETARDESLKPYRMIVTGSALVLGWVFANLIDKQNGYEGERSVAYYGLDYQDFNSKQIKNFGDPLLFPEMRLDIYNLSMFMYRTLDKARELSNKNPPPLFDYNKHMLYSRFSNTSRKENPWLLKAETGDYQYAKTLALTLPEDAWKDADKELNKLLENIYARDPNLKSTYPEIDKAVWRTNWAYVNNQLPSHFQSLRQLALMAFRESPNLIQGGIPTDLKGMPTDFEFSGVNVQPAPEGYEKEWWITYDQGLTFDRSDKPESLPSVKGKILENLPEKAIKPFPSPVLWTNDQHEIVTTYVPRLHPSLTILSLNHDPEKSRRTPSNIISLNMLIDYYSENVHELDTSEGRIVFAFSLNQHKVYTTLREFSGITNRLIEFFDKTIERHQDSIAFENRTDLVDPLLFIMEQKQRILRILFDKPIIEPSKKLEETRALVQLLKKSPNFANPIHQQYLNLILCDSFNEEKKLSDQEIGDLIETRARLENNLLDTGLNPHVFPVILNTAKIATVAHREEIREYLTRYPEKRNALMNGLLKDFYVTNTAPWQESAFPLYQCTNEGITYQLNVLTGEMLKNGTKFSAIANLRNDSLYKELFGSKILIGVKSEKFVESEDEIGGIRFYLEDIGLGQKVIKSVQRKLQGEWFQYLPSNSKEVPHLPNSPDSAYLQIWRNVNEKNNELTFIDKRTMEFRYKLDAEGYFHFPYNKIDDPAAKKYEWVEISKLHEGQGIARFDPEAIVWKPAPGESHPPLLTFPNYKDEEGHVLEFVQKGSDWVSVASPHLHIAKEQTISPIANFFRFLVLEDASGKREVLIPKQTFSSIQSDKSIPSACEKIQVIDGVLTSHSPGQNAYLAYLFLTHAVSHQDYVVAMEYLKKAFSFEKYSPEDLRVMGWIFNSVKEKPDASGSMASIRLYAAWLVHDNLKRNPSTLDASAKKTNPSTIPALNGEGKDWVAYWNNQWQWEKIKGKAGQRNLSTQLDKVTKDYLKKRSQVNHAVKLENILEPQELIRWGMEQRAEVAGVAPPKSLPVEMRISTIKTLSNFRGYNALLNKDFLFEMRPGKDFISSFSDLYKRAKSPDEKDRKYIDKLLYGAAYDNYTDNAVMRKILQAALIASDPDSSKQGYSEAQALVKLIDAIYLNPFLDYDKPTDDLGLDSKMTDRDAKEQFVCAKLNNLIREFAQATPTSLEWKYSPSVSNIKNVATIVPKHEPHVLPTEFPSGNKMTYAPGTPPLNALNALGNKFLVAEKKIESVVVDPFVYETDDPLLEASIKELNHDYEIGAKKNQSKTVFALKEGQLGQVVGEIEKSAKDISASYVKKQEALKEAMLKLARKLPVNLEQKVLEEAAILGGQKKEIGIKECIVLFLQNDVGNFKEQTHLNEQEIQTLYQNIGDYLVCSTAVNHTKTLLADIQKLKTISDIDGKDTERSALLQKIGQGLSQKDHIDLAKDPNAFLVLEYGLELFIRENQVKSLRDVLATKDPKKFANCMLQLIQGGGKTLVFGHVLALLKADGYHLSVHVPATPQYGTARYDMRYTSGKVFGQKEHTMEFDDDPNLFSTEFLSWMKDTMTSSVVKRDYITVTNETLRAMRCKYIKTRLMIEEIDKSGGSTQDLEEKNALLKDVLNIMTTRGVFTFDEHQLAFAPKTELNMPFGAFSRISLQESKLIAKLISFAASAREDGESLLGLTENRQSQQTQENYQKMIEYTVDKFLGDTSMEAAFSQVGISENEENKKVFRSYLLGETKDLPAYITLKRENASRILQTECSPAEKEEALLLKQTCDLLVLGKQLIAGNWLKDRLATSVDEHHGFSSKEGEGPRISIPFVANKSPAEGSEFSDRYVMIINTLMGYTVHGISETQLEGIIEQLKKNAYTEQMNALENDTQISLKDTKAVKQFKELFDLDLLALNSKNPLYSQMIDTIQQKLHSGTEETLQYLYDYVVTNVLSQVEIFDRQICSNGRNTASMAQSFFAYSGSLDNKNLAPPGTVVIPDEGTNGQTIDLLLRQNNDVWVIPPATTGEEDPLFTNLMEKHENKEQIRAIIDVGCHFRGVSNQDVAKKINEHLRKTSSPIQGVLFFNPTNGSLYFMNKQSPNDPKKLSGTDADIIKSETGFPPEQIFTYYDQDHSTGVNILQAEDTEAVLTWSEHSKIHEPLQGGNRLRQLALQQRLISVTEPGVLNKIANKLKKPEIASLQLGKVDQKQNLIKDLILFSHIQEIKPQRDENLLFCLQDMEDTVQKFLLDKLYSATQENEKALFSKVSSLFSKSIAIDLYREFANQRKAIPIAEFLEASKKRLLDMAAPGITESEKDFIAKKMSDIIQNIIKGLSSTIEVPQDFDANHAAIYQNRDATMIQYRKQEQKTVQQVENVSVQQNEQQKLSEMEMSLYKNSKVAYPNPFTQEDLENPTFANEIKICDGISIKIKRNSMGMPLEAHAEIWSLNQSLNKVMKEQLGDLFDPNILLTSNLAIAWEKRVDLLGSFRKVPYQWLAICDTKPEGKQWKLVLVSAEEAPYMIKNLEKAKMPEGRSMYMMRTSMDGTTVMKGAGSPLDSKECEADPQLQKLIAQTLFFGGRLDVLNKKKVRETLDSALPQGMERRAYQRFFEEQILQGKTADYIGSPLQRLLMKYQDVQ